MSDYYDSNDPLHHHSDLAGRGFFGEEPLPNSSLILALGILSIVTCFCWGIVGLGCSIVALVMAASANRTYHANPEAYTRVSVQNVRAGKVCAIIGLICSSLWFIIMVVAFVAEFGFFNRFFPTS